MPAWEIEYKLGQYSSSVLVQAETNVKALQKAHQDDLIPAAATIIRVVSRG